MTGLGDVMISEVSQSLNWTDSTSSFGKKSGIDSDTDGVDIYFGELKLLVNGGGLKTGGEPSFEMRGAGVT